MRSLISVLAVLCCCFSWAHAEFYTPFMGQNLLCTRNGLCYGCCGYKPGCVHPVGTIKKQIDATTTKADRTPLQKARELSEAFEFSPEERQADTSLKLYQCPHSETLLLNLRYGEYAYRFWVISNTHTLSWQDYCGESPFKKDEQRLFNYLCNLSIPNVLKTGKFPSFETTVATKAIKEIPLYPGKETFPAQSTTKHTMPAARKPTTAQPAQPAQKAWPLLGLTFYSATVPGNFKQVRRFTTKDGQVEIKINFTSSDKSAFYQKLQIKYDGQLTQGTECNDGSRLLETAVNGLYQAYLLKPNAILVLTFGYPPQTASPFLPREKRLQLCAADLSTVW